MREIVYYRCKVTNGSETVISDEVVIKLDRSEKPKIQSITSTATNGLIKKGQPYTITVKATGKNLKYQWEWCTDGKSWANSTCEGNTAATVNLVGKRNIVYYRCKITSGSETIVSDEVVIKMK